MTRGTRLRAGDEVSVDDLHRPFPFDVRGRYSQVVGLWPEPTDLVDEQEAGYRILSARHCIGLADGGVRRLPHGKNAIAGFLLVDEIGRLRPEPDHLGVTNLNVEWERAMEVVDGHLVACAKPGASGHCGITRLHQEFAKDGTPLKVYRKSLYGLLARMANGRRVAKLR